MIDVQTSNRYRSKASSIDLINITLIIGFLASLTAHSILVCITG
ncbi:hypothetical protein ROLI_047050 (plasmid) [Roseobacter fucihabitans]|uniref:Uncharacterized protein n=1 Tax=Roseobacter fucihabitans TaxID=1537242 RepID=A0ABZ2C002_9RHOB